MFFDNAGESQGNRVKYRIGYREAGGGDYGPLPQGTKGYAGDAHLAFYGIPEGENGGGTDGGGGFVPDYTPTIQPSVTSVTEGDPVTIYVEFRRAAAYPGTVFAGTDGDPDRPKESFRFTNANSGEQYICTSTYNSLNPADYDPTEWGYNEMPTPPANYERIDQTQAHSGTMIYENPTAGTALYAFEFIAPSVEGSYDIEMDVSEWWTKPYGTEGAERLSGVESYYPVTLNGSPRRIKVLKRQASIPGELYDRTAPSYTYIRRTVYSIDEWDTWQAGASQQYEVWYQGALYVYDPNTQQEYVESKTVGQSMSLENYQITFGGQSAWEFLAVVEQGVRDLIAEGVLKLQGAVEPGTGDDACTCADGKAGTKDPVTGECKCATVTPTPTPVNPNPGGGIEQRNNRLIDINDGWFDNDSWYQETDEFGTLFTVYGSEATPGKISLVIPMPEVGAYDISIQRIDDRKTGGTVDPTPDYGPDNPGVIDPRQTREEEIDDSRYIDDSSWTRLASRGIPQDDAVLNLQHRHTLSELEFEANQAIQGNVQEVSAILRSRLRTWKNGSWRGLSFYDADGEYCYNNPAWIVVDILLGYSIQNKRAPRYNLDECGWLRPDQLDLDSFYDFSKHCNETVGYQGPNGYATRRRYTFNGVMASDAPIIETCQNILGQCRAQLIITQLGKIGVMRDEARTTPRQLFTPSNSWGFSGSRSFVEIPHCFNVQFTSPELGWQIATVQVYRPGYSANGIGDTEVASVFEDLDTVGVTNAHQAQLYGSYMLAQAVIRNETFTLTTDVENLVCQRGDMCEIAHDAPLTGGRSCVIAGEADGWLEVSERFEGLTGDTNSYTLRTTDGTIAYGSVTAVDGDRIQIQNQNLADVGNLIVVGPANTVTEKYLIQSITPKPDLTAEISLVKYDPRVYEVDNGQFPVWNPNFNQNIGEGGTQDVYSVSGSSVLVFESREPYTHATFNWSIWPDNDSVGGFLIEMQTLGNPRRELDYVAGGTRTYTHKYDSRDTSMGGATTYFITPYSTLGYKGRTGNITLSKRTDFVSPSVSGFSATYTMNGNTQLTWDEPVDPDIQAYSIYYKREPINPGFGGEKIGQAAYNRTDWLIEGQREGLYWIVAVDTSGNTSNPAFSGSYDYASYPTPSLVTPFNIRLSLDKNSGQLYWKPLLNEYIDYYSLYRADGLVPSVSEAVLLGNVNHRDVDELTLDVADPYGYFFITATNVFGVTGPANSLNSTYPVPGAVQNFRLWVEQGLGVLKWDLLDDATIASYQLRYSENVDETNPDAATEYGSTDANTNAYPSEKLQGSFFIRAKNRWNIYGPWTRTTSVFQGLGIINASLTQSLRFIGRYPFSDVLLRWGVTGDQSLISRYRVYFYPTDPVMATRFEDGELVAERPPVLVYEGQEKQCLTTVSTTEDTGRQHGVFIIQVISIYGTPGDEASLDFQVIKDVVAPMAPERFFVNILNNTNADLSWLASQSIDVDTYDLRYTPELSSPRWEASEHIATVGWNVTGYQTNARTGTYLIRATDTSGNVSEVVKQRTTVADLPDMNVIERVEDAPEWLGKKVYFIKDGSRLLMDGAPYTGGDEFGAEPYREAFYYYHERIDLGRIYETRLTAKLQAYGQLSGSVMADWPTLAEIDPISGVEESADWDCWVEYRTGTEEDVIADWVNMVDQDPIAGSVASDWTDWRAFFAADVTARFIDFRIVARAYNPNAEVGVVSGLVEVDMPDRYWTKADIPVGLSGASVSIDPPFKHLEAVAVTVDGNDYNVRAVVSDKKPSGFNVNLIDQTTGANVAGQIDVFCSGYGIEAPEII